MSTADIGYALLVLPSQTEILAFIEEVVVRTKLRHRGKKEIQGGTQGKLNKDKQGAEIAGFVGVQW